MKLQILSPFAILIFINLIALTIGFTNNFYFVLGSNGKAYQFGYDTENSDGQPRLMREEGRMQDGTVIGRYGYTDPFGVFRVVKYAAGPNGYYAFEDVDGGRSSSVPLFFKATARQLENTFGNGNNNNDSNNNNSNNNDSKNIENNFNPPLYHPEAHLAEVPPLNENLDEDFQKLISNAQRSTTTTSTTTSKPKLSPTLSSHLGKKNKEEKEINPSSDNNDSRKYIESLGESFRRLSVQEKPINFENLPEEKVNNNNFGEHNHNDEVIKESESIRISRVKDKSYLPEQDANIPNSQKNVQPKIYFSIPSSTFSKSSSSSSSSVSVSSSSYPSSSPVSSTLSSPSKLPSTSSFSFPSSQTFRSSFSSKPFFSTFSRPSIESKQSIDLHKEKSTTIFDDQLSHTSSLFPEVSTSSLPKSYFQRNNARSITLPKNNQNHFGLRNFDHKNFDQDLNRRDFKNHEIIPEKRQEPDWFFKILKNAVTTESTKITSSTTTTEATTTTTNKPATTTTSTTTETTTTPIPTTTALDEISSTTETVTLNPLTEPDSHLYYGFYKPVNKEILINETKDETNKKVEKDESESPENISSESPVFSPKRITAENLGKQPMLSLPLPPPSPVFTKASLTSTTTTTETMIDANAFVTPTPEHLISNYESFKLSNKITKIFSHNKNNNNIIKQIKSDNTDIADNNTRKNNRENEDELNENKTPRRIIRVWFKKGDVIFSGPKQVEEEPVRRQKIIRFRPQDFKSPIYTTPSPTNQHLTTQSYIAPTASNPTTTTASETTTTTTTVSATTTVAPITEPFSFSENLYSDETTDANIEEGISTTTNSPNIEDIFTKVNKELYTVPKLFAHINSKIEENGDSILYKPPIELQRTTNIENFQTTTTLSNSEKESSESININFERNNHNTDNNNNNENNADIISPSSTTTILQTQMSSYIPPIPMTSSQVSTDHYSLVDVLRLSSIGKQEDIKDVK